MQSRSIDASNRVTSLDSGYYVHGYKSNEVVTVAHKALHPGEIDLQVGDVVQLKEVYLGTAIITGRNMRTNMTGNYPWFKSRPQVQVADYPTYPEATRNIPSK